MLKELFTITPYSFSHIIFENVKRKRDFWIFFTGKYRSLYQQKNPSSILYIIFPSLTKTRDPAILLVLPENSKENFFGGVPWSTMYILFKEDIGIREFVRRERLPKRQSKVEFSFLLILLKHTSFDVYPFFFFIKIFKTSTRQSFRGFNSFKNNFSWCYSSNFIITKLSSRFHS